MTKQVSFPTVMQPDALGASPPIKIGNRLSIVVPCYNEEEVLPETAKRLRALLDHLTTGGKIAAESQVILVDDGSRDRTWELIRQFNAEDARIRGLKLSCNRGHQTALIAGLFAADGDAVASIDADLQDDVSAIEAMVDAYRQGCEVIYGVRNGRGVDSVFKRSAANAYYRLLTLLNVKVVPNHADFRLLSRRALRVSEGVFRSQPIPSRYRAIARLSLDHRILRSRRALRGPI